MMRPVVYVLGAYPVWSESFLRQDITGLLAAGVPLLPVCLHPGDCERLDEWPDVTCLSHSGTGGPAMTRRAGAHTGRHLPPKAATAFSLWHHRHLAHDLDALVLKRQAIHVHAEFADLPGLLAASVARRRGLTHSLGVHAQDVHEGKFTPRSVYAGASFVLTCNAAARDEVVRQCPFLPPNYVHLIHHGLNLHAWPFEPSAGAVPNRPVQLLFVGRFVEKKGIDTALQALRILADSGTPARLTLAGDGPLLQELKDGAAGLGVADCLDWVGVVSQERILMHLRQAQVLIVPSRIAQGGDRDGIPNVLLEAMAAGTPVLGTAVGGLGEALTETTGWIVAPEDPRALAAAIVQLCGDVSGRRQRVMAARRLVETHFDANALAARRAALFQRATEASP